METFKIAVTSSSFYAFYETVCADNRTEPHPYVLKYTGEVIQNSKAPFCFKEFFLDEAFFSPIYEYLKKNKLIENMTFQDFALDSKTANIILQLITNFSRTQLTHLVFQR